MAAFVSVGWAADVPTFSDKDVGPVRTETATPPATKTEWDPAGEMTKAEETRKAALERAEADFNAAASDVCRRLNLKALALPTLPADPKESEALRERNVRYVNSCINSLEKNDGVARVSSLRNFLLKPIPGTSTTPYQVYLTETAPAGARK